MNILKQAAMVMVLAVGTAGLAEAHHAGNSQFDGNKVLPFQGVLEKVYSGNPHGYLYFVRTLPNDQQQHWVFETDAILAMHRAGLSVRNDLKIGDSFSLAYNPALDGSNGGNLVAIQIKSGRVIAFMTKNNVETAKKLLREKLFNNDTQNSQGPH
ncbi:MAG TPA: DUF6152 family protein [Steroidobacteraceae bacterium]|nr:DUF6152 family protein [Steroidobacteraceae bacterium]